MVTFYIYSKRYQCEEKIHRSETSKNSSCKLKFIIQYLQARSLFINEYNNSTDFYIINFCLMITTLTESILRISVKWKARGE